MEEIDWINSELLAKAANITPQTAKGVLNNAYRHNKSWRGSQLEVRKTSTHLYEVDITTLPNNVFYRAAPLALGMDMDKLGEKVIYKVMKSIVNTEKKGYKSCDEMLADILQDVKDPGDDDVLMEGYFASIAELDDDEAHEILEEAMAGTPWQGHKLKVYHPFKNDDRLAVAVNSLPRYLIDSWYGIK